VSISAIARGVLAGANRNRQEAEERDRQLRAEAEARRRREFDEQIASTTAAARLAEQGFIFGDDADEDAPDVRQFFDEPERDEPRRGGPPRPTGSGQDFDDELGELPDLPVVQDHTGTPIYSPARTPASSQAPDSPRPPRRPMEIAREIAQGGRAPRRRPVKIGTIIVDGKPVPVSFDRENTPAAKAARRNRAAYEQLRGLGFGDEFDEGEDYPGMLREQRTEREQAERRADVISTLTAALVAKRIPEAQAQRLAALYVKPDGSVLAGIGDYLDEEDLETFREKETIRARIGAQYRAPREEPSETPAQKRATRLRSARGNAARWAEGGRSIDAIEGALARYYPDISLGELKGIAIAVVREKKRADRGGADDSGGAFFDDDDDDDESDKGEAPDSVVDAALRKFGGDEAKATAYLRSQGYR
jgi:hypothetical protein